MPRLTVVLGLLTLATVAGMQCRAAGAGRRPDEHQTRGGVPAGHDRDAPWCLSGARHAAAEHRRLPSTLDARHRRASRAQGEVPGDRRARAPAVLDLARGYRRRGRGHGRTQPARAGQRRQFVRRAVDARAAGDQRQPAQGSVPRARRHRLPQRRSGMGRKGGAAARGRHQGRRHRRRRDWQGLRPHHAQARRQPAQGRRPGAGSDLGSLSPAGSPGVHPHG